MHVFAAGVPKVLSRYGVSAVRQWMDLYNKEREERVLYLFSELSPRVTEDLLASLLLLEDKRDGKGELHQPIYLHMHSTGGSLTNAFALLDLIKLMSSPVYTINCGLCASSASLLLAGGTPGHRYALEGSRVLLHLPMGALGGPLAELQQEAEDVKRVTQQVARLYGHFSVKQGPEGPFVASGAPGGG